MKNSILILNKSPVAIDKINTGIKPKRINSGIDNFLKDNRKNDAVTMPNGKMINVIINHINRLKTISFYLEKYSLFILFTIIILLPHAQSL